MSSTTSGTNSTRTTENGATIRVAGRVTASSRSRKVRTPKGRTLGKPQAAKADGKWNRKDTARGASPEVPQVRVKRWGKSPPAPWRHGGSSNPVRCKVKQIPLKRPAEGSGTPLEPSGNRRPRGMVTLDRIRLRGLLKENPAICRVFPFWVAHSCITGASHLPSSGPRLRTAAPNVPLFMRNPCPRSSTSMRLRKSVAYRGGPRRDL